MDEMKIVSKFTRGIVAKIIGSILKKAGYNVDIQLNEFNATVNDGVSHVHLNIDAELEKTELLKLLKLIGLQ